MPKNLTTGSTEADRIKEGRPIRSFTDDPSLMGTQNLKIGPEYGGGPSMWEAPPKDPYASRKRTAQAKIPPRPPNSVMYPPGESDFKNREKYSAFVIGKMGFDPDTLDPYAEVEKAQELELPSVFEKAFGGKILYRDKDNLTKEEKDHWNVVHKAFNVYVKDRATDKAKRGKDEYKTRMKVFDDKLAEKKAIPDLMQTSLESIFLSLDEDGTKIGKVPAGELASAIRIAEQMVNEGASGYEAIDKATKEVIKKRLAQQGASDALGEIPEMEKGIFAGSPDIKTVKSIVKNARQQGASYNDILKKLKEQGWNDKNIAKLLPKDTAGAKAGLEVLQQKVLKLKTANPESYKKFMDYAKQNFTGKKPEEVKVLTEKWLASESKPKVATAFSPEGDTGKATQAGPAKANVPAKAKTGDKIPPKPDFATPMIIGGGSTKEQRQAANKEMDQFLSKYFGVGTENWKSLYGDAKKAGGIVFEGYMKLAGIIDEGWAKVVESQKESIKQLGK